MIKVTSGFNLKETLFSPGGVNIKKTAEIFFKHKCLYYFDAPRDQGLKKQNHPVSLDLVVLCTEIGPKTKKLRKPVQKPSFFDVFCVVSEVFQT